MTLVTAAIILKNNTVLLARRKPGEQMAGYWEFPGGKIEKGETLQACLERELFEEFGVRAKAKGIVAESIYEYDDGSIKLVGILTDVQDHAFKLTVHDKIRWVAVADILNYRLAPADIPIAKQICLRFGSWIS